MNVLRPVAAPVAALLLSACQGPPPPDPSAAVPVGTAAQAQSDAPVCAVFPHTDVMILSSNPNVNEDALAGVRFFTGTTVGGAPGYTLLRFDVGSIPSAAHVVSATATVEPMWTQGIGTVNVHTVLGAWDPTTVTWSDFAGGFDPSPAGSFPVGVAPWSAGPILNSLVPVSFNLSSLVQRWVSGAVANNGVLLEQSLVETGTSFTYYDDDAAAAPTLQVCYVAGNPCLGVTCTASDQCHAAGTCNPATGACSNPAKPDGTACNDGNACTQTDTCQAGVCTGAQPGHLRGARTSATSPAPATRRRAPAPTRPSRTAPPATTATPAPRPTPARPAPARARNPVTCAALGPVPRGRHLQPGDRRLLQPARVANGTACNDGNACTQSDTCQAGACTGGNPVACTALDQCHAAGTCNPATGVCSNPAKADGTACNDGNACTQTDTCQGGTCTGGNPVTCTAVDPCHAAGTCDPSTGKCSANGVLCGTDVSVGLQSMGGVASASDSYSVNPPSTINDGVASTSANGWANTDQPGSRLMILLARKYTLTKLNIFWGGNNAGNWAAGTDTYLPRQYMVQVSSDPTALATDTVASPKWTALSDAANNLAASYGTVSGTHVLPGFTNASWGTTQTITFTPTPAIAVRLVFDGSPVSVAGANYVGQVGEVDVRAASSACGLPDGTACDDGSACTTGDTCQASVCTGTAQPDGTTCNGGDACSFGTCHAGACTGVSPVVCTPSDPCHTAGTCDPVTGTCSDPAVVDGTACSGTNACFEGNSCQSGACTLEGPVATPPSGPAFSAAAVSSSAAYLAPVLIGDFNGDGKLDIAGPTDDSVTILFGNGDGTFQNPGPALPGAPFYDMGTVGDFNGDGKLDLALEHGNGLTISLGKGDGTFQAPGPAISAGSAYPNFVTVAAADFNGDGKLDIAGVNRATTPASVSVLLGKGDGTFLPAQSFTAGSIYSGITTADFNGDGKVDIAVTNGAQVSVLLGKGDGTFLAVQSFSVDSSYTASNAIAAGDFNGDGKADIAVANATGVCVLLGKGDGTFLPFHDFAVGSYPTSLAAADLNVDGIADLAVTYSKTVSVLFGKSDGTFLPAESITTGLNPTSARVADFNRDGKPDILTGDTTVVGPSILLSTISQACFACDNPLVPDGALCDDGNVCTSGDTCHAHACVGQNLPDGTSCSTRANVSGTCTAGTCHDVCNVGFADCGGTCTGIVSDNANCGGCGVTCAGGTTCASGSCVSSNVLSGCATTSPLSVLVQGNSVTAYVTNGYWTAGFLPTRYQGIQVVPLEGGAAQAGVETPSMVNTCAANAVTGEVVCVANNTDVYTVQGTTLTNTLHSSSNHVTAFSDGGGQNVGVTIDPAANRAAISIGLSSSPGGYYHAFQFLDLSTNTFAAPIPVTTEPSEQFVADPVRKLLFSAGEDGFVTLLDMTTDKPYYWPVDVYAYFDSSAEDCATGIVVGAGEDGGPFFLADLNQASLSGTTWSAPFSAQSVGTHDGFAIAQGSHLALGFDEIGSGFTVMRLPATAGSGVPQVVDYASGYFTSFTSSLHGTGAYVSPADGKAYGVVPSFAGDQLVLIDLQAVLDAPRIPLYAGGHNINGDPVALGLVRFVPILGHPLYVDNPSVAESPVLGTSVGVSTLGSDPAGEAALTYTWSSSGPAPVTFAPNGTNAAKNSTAVFTAPGDYLFTATLAGSHGFTAQRDVYLSVPEVLESFTAAPPTLALNIGENATISADGRDQFGVFMRGSNFIWSKVAGPAGGTANFGNVSATTTTVSFDTPGSYTDPGERRRQLHGAPHRDHRRHRVPAQPAAGGQRRAVAARRARRRRALLRHPARHRHRRRPAPRRHGDQPVDAGQRPVRGHDHGPGVARDPGVLRHGRRLHVPPHGQRHGALELRRGPRGHRRARQHRRPGPGNPLDAAARGHRGAALHVPGDRRRRGRRHADLRARQRPRGDDRRPLAGPRRVDPARGERGPEPRGRRARHGFARVERDAALRRHGGARARAAGLHHGAAARRGGGRDVRLRRRRPRSRRHLVPLGGAGPAGHGGQRQRRRELGGAGRHHGHLPGDAHGDRHDRPLGDPDVRDRRPRRRGRRGAAGEHHVARGRLVPQDGGRRRWHGARRRPDGV